MAHNPSLLPLKVLVISLGMVLLGGMVFVATLIVHPPKPAPCPDASLHLGALGAIGNVTAQGDKIQIVTTKGQETKVLTVDRCTGALLQTLTVVP